MFHVTYVFSSPAPAVFNCPFTNGCKMQIVKLVVVQYSKVLCNGINFLMDY